jgi:bacteriorhodopsin
MLCHAPQVLRLVDYLPRVADPSIQPGRQGSVQPTRRMMKFLVAYQIMMTSGATASMIDNGYRWLFYCNG